MKSWGIEKSSIQNLHSTVRTLKKKLITLENEDIWIEWIKWHIWSGWYFWRNWEYSPENISEYFVIEQGIYFFPWPRVIFSEDAWATKLWTLEYLIFYTFISSPWSIFSREDIANIFSEYTWQQIDPDNVPSYVNRIRKILNTFWVDLWKKIPYERSLLGYKWDDTVKIDNTYSWDILSISLQKLRKTVPQYSSSIYEWVSFKKDELIFCVLLEIYDGSLNFNALERYMSLRWNSQAQYVFWLMNTINQKFSSAWKLLRVSARKTTFAFSHIWKKDDSNKISLAKWSFEN